MVAVTYLTKSLTQDDDSFIRSKRMAGGDLFDRLVRNGPIPELEAKFLAYQAFVALQVQYYFSDLKFPLTSQLFLNR